MKWVQYIIAVCLVFLLVFLVWPTTYYPDSATCNEGPYMLDDSANDCASQQSYEALGGGIRYITRVIKKGGYSEPENTADYYFVSDSSMFHPKQALMGAAMAGSATGIAMALVRRRRASKTRAN